MYAFFVEVSESLTSDPFLSELKPSASESFLAALCRINTRVHRYTRRSFSAVALACFAFDLLIFPVLAFLRRVLALDLAKRCLSGECHPKPWPKRRP